MTKNFLIVGLLCYFAIIIVWNEYYHIHELQSPVPLLLPMKKTDQEDSFETVATPRKTIKSNSPQLSPKESNSVILASWFTYRKDPQRGIQVSQNINYIWNFYITSNYLGLRTVIFHDHLSPDFVTKYSTDAISFRKVNACESFTTNDLRFIIYYEFIETYTYEWILLTDASDVYFNSNPFILMHYDRNNASLFLSPDIETFKSNGWMKRKVKECYPEGVQSWALKWSLKIFNAGVWGGRKSVIQCILLCISNELTKVVKGRGNCNMATVNWCIRFGNCANENDIEANNVKSLFVNPFRKGCTDRKYCIIHNKCQRTEGKICAFIKDNSIRTEFRNGKNCNDLSQ